MRLKNVMRGGLLAALLLPAGRAFAQFTINGATVSFNNNAEFRTSTITINSGGQLNSGTSFIALSNSLLNNSGVFTAVASTVAFQNALTTATISGDNQFHTLLSTAAGKNLVFQAGKTQTVQGNFLVSGQKGGRIKLRSSAAGSIWNLSFPSASQSVSYVDVQDSDVLGNQVTASRSISQGNNNALWVFTGPVPGCGAGFLVMQDGSEDYPTIQAAVNALPPSLSTTTCVVVADDEIYGEQVTVQGFANNGYRLLVMADPTFVSSRPVISPPASSTGAFHIMNDSVSVQGFDLQAAVIVPYGILSSSAHVVISSVNINGGAMINAAAISIASRTAVMHSFATASAAHGLRITASDNAVMYSTMTSASNTRHALYIVPNADRNDVSYSYIYNLSGNGAYIEGSDYNIVDNCVLGSNYSTLAGISIATASSDNKVRNSSISNPAGAAARIDNSSTYNTISDSIITSANTGKAALELRNNANYNQLLRNSVSNTAGWGLGVQTYSSFNNIVQSTITSAGAGFAAAYFSQAGTNTVADCYIQGSTAAHVAASTATIFRGSVFVATATAGHALLTDGDVFVTTSTLAAGPAGAAVNLIQNYFGKVELTSNTVTAGAYGISAGSRAAGAELYISSITFASLSPGATAVSFSGGGYYFAVDIASADFASANIAVNVNGTGLDAGSFVRLPEATGRWGALYEYDPSGNIFWDTITPELLGPADLAGDVSQAPGLHVRAPAAETSAQYYYQLDTMPTMTMPPYSFDQWSAQVFSSSGAFSGQDSTMALAGDAYLYSSTATFVFFSTGTRLEPNTTYYWRAKVRTAQTGEFGPWTTIRSFTTGRAASSAPVNNIDIGNIALSSTTGLSARINFTLRDNNVSTGTTAGGAAYNTADWVFVKFSTQAGADGSWNHATLAGGGGIGPGGVLTVASDKKGAFIDHTTNYAMWQATASLVWNYAADGVSGTDALVKVFAISMVKVPTGSFVYNAGGIGGSTANNYGGGSQANVTSPGDIPSGAAAGWPNGYSSFYIMRYEITQGQYADFLNTVHSSTATARYESAVAFGHNIPYNGANPYGSRYWATDRFAAKNYLSTADLWTYLSWAALRPMTEMEFEKAARDISGDTRTYPWGSTAPDTATYNPRNEGGTATRNFLNYNGTANKVLDSGRYLSGDVYRTAEQTGASPYGIADLAGNVYEHMLNCSYLSVPASGNGTVVWPAGWPAASSDQKGLRGGYWGVDTNNAQVSIRVNSGWTSTLRTGNVGGRGARTP